MSEQVDMLPDNYKEDFLNFTKRYVNLMLELKRVKEDMKALCQEYEELGVPTKVAVKAINEQKKVKKSNAREREEIELFKDWMSQSTEIDDALAELIAK